MRTRISLLRKSRRVRDAGRSLMSKATAAASTRTAMSLTSSGAVSITVARRLTGISAVFELRLSRILILPVACSMALMASSIRSSAMAIKVRSVCWTAAMASLSRLFSASSSACLRWASTSGRVRWFACLRCSSRSACTWAAVLPPEVVAPWSLEVGLIVSAMAYLLKLVAGHPRRSRHG
jgi:hypothetical protein